MGDKKLQIHSTPNYLDQYSKHVEPEATYLEELSPSSLSALRLFPDGPGGAGLSWMVRRDARLSVKAMDDSHIALILYVEDVEQVHAGDTHNNRYPFLLRVSEALLWSRMELKQGLLYFL